MIIRKLDKYIKNKNERKYKNLKLIFYEMLLQIEF